MATETEALVVSLEARIRDFERNFQKANKTANTNWRAIEARGRQAATRIQRDAGGAAAGVNRAMQGMTAGLGRIGLSGLVGGVSVIALQRYADGWIRVQNQLKVVGLEGDKLESTLGDLFDIAQRNGVAIEPLVTLYGRLAQAQSELGATNQELTKFTEGVSLALKVAGTDAGQAGGALLQLSQAIGGAVVRAEEFNSINEGARPILQAVANGLKEAGGSVSTLRNLVIDGKISSEAFFRAFLAGMGDLEAKAASTGQTSSQAFARIQNAMTRLVGEVDKTANASGKLADVFNRIAEGLDYATGKVGPFLTKLEELRERYFWILDYIGPQALLQGNFLGPIVPLIDSTKRLIDQARGVQEAAKSLESERPPLSAMSPAKSTNTVSLADFKLPGDDDVTKSRARVKTYDDIRQSAERYIATLETERAALGMATGDAEALRMEQQLLSEAQRAGVSLTDNQRAGITALATQYGTLAAEIEKTTASQTKLVNRMDDLRGTATDVLGSFASDLRNGTSMADALSGALDRIIDQLLDMALNALVTAALGPLGSASGGFLGSLTGGVLKAATGGKVSGPGSSTSDSIPALLSDGEFVVNAAATRRHRVLLEAVNSGKVPTFAAGGSASPSRLPTVTSARSAAPVITINSPVTVNGSAGSPEQNSDLARKMAKELEATMRRTVMSEVLSQMRPGGVLNR